jgi:hypothetical protein
VPWFGILRLSLLIVFIFDSGIYSVKINVDGILMYSHICWAKQMCLLCENEKDITGLLIPQVCRKLPQTMRSLVSRAHTDGLQIGRGF